MRARLPLAIGLAVWTLAPAHAQDARAVIAAAMKAMGTEALTSITLAGSAVEGNFGQSRTITFGLASTSIRNYQVTYDFTRAAMHATGDGVPGPPGRRGGLPPPAGPYEVKVTAQSPWPQQFQVWVTPWGFLRGAAANGATVQDRKISGVPYRLLTWSPPVKAPSGKPYRVVGYVNAQQIVDRVETWVDHPIFGDLHIDTTYIDFQGVGGVKVPARSSQKRAAMETFATVIRGAVINPADGAELAAGPAPQSSPVAEAAASEKLADGVYRIAGAYVSLAVEFTDHVVVIEAGPSEARALAVMAEVKRLFPAKRIRYVVSTHPHFDHSAGLAPYIAQGVAVVADDNSKFFVEAAFSEPRTLVGDLLGRSGKKPKVEGVVDSLVLADGTRTLQLHHVEDLPHTDSMLIAFLPKERLLFTADFDPPRPGQPVSPSIATLAANLDRLKLDFDRHVTVHTGDPGRPLTRAELDALAKEAR